MRNLYPFPRLLTIIGATLICSISLYSAENPNSRRVEKFKEFLSNPPTVKMVRFSSPRPYPTKDENGYVHFAGRYQADGFLLSQVSPTDTILPRNFEGAILPGFCAWGYHQGDYWALQSKALQTWKDDGK